MGSQLAASQRPPCPLCEAQFITLARARARRRPRSHARPMGRNGWSPDWPPDRSATFNEHTNTHSHTLCQRAPLFPRPTRGRAPDAGRARLWQLAADKRENSHRSHKLDPRFFARPRPARPSGARGRQANRRASERAAELEPSSNGQQVRRVQFQAARTTGEPNYTFARAQ